MRLLAPTVSAAALAAVVLLAGCTSSGAPDSGALSQLAGAASGSGGLSGLGTAAWALQHLDDFTALSGQLSALGADVSNGSASSATAVCSSLLSESTKLLDQDLPPDPALAQQLRTALQSVQTTARQCASGDPSVALSELQSALAGLSSLPSTP